MPRCPLHVVFSNRPFWVKHFQAIHHWVLMSLAGSRFSSESALRPFHHGVRRRGGTIYWAALPSDEPQVQADIRTHLIHRPARDIIPPRGGARVPPIAFDPLGLSYRCYFPGPAELGAVNHSVVPDDCQQAAMQDAELLAKLPSDNQQRFDQNRRSGPASSPIRLKW